MPETPSTQVSQRVAFSSLVKVAPSPKTSVRDYSCRTVLYEPRDMLFRKLFVNLQVLVKTSCDCGHYALKFEFHLIPHKSTLHYRQAPMEPELCLLSNFSRSKELSSRLFPDSCPSRHDDVISLLFDYHNPRSIQTAHLHNDKRWSPYPEVNGVSSRNSNAFANDFLKRAFWRSLGRSWSALTPAATKSGGGS